MRHYLLGARVFYQRWAAATAPHHLPQNTGRRCHLSDRRAHPTSRPPQLKSLATVTQGLCSEPGPFPSGLVWRISDKGIPAFFFFPSFPSLQQRKGRKTKACQEKHRSFSSNPAWQHRSGSHYEAALHYSRPVWYPHPRGMTDPGCPDQSMQKKTSRRRKDLASSGQGSLPSRCSGPGNRNPASMGRGDTPSTAPHAGRGIERRSRVEREGGGGHTDMLGGWRRTISLLEAKEGRSWQHGQGEWHKTTWETSGLGGAGGEPQP